MTSTPATAASLEVHLLGVVDYAACKALQDWLVFDLSGRVDERGVLLLCEHPSHLTLGAEASREHVRVSDEGLAAKELEPEWVSRGGGAVLHGPGQLAVYPMLPVGRRGIGAVDLRRGVESASCLAAERVKVAAWRRAEAPGLWTRQGQVASFGMAVEQGVSRHGLHLNVAESSSRRLVCGNAFGERMTSLQTVRTSPIAMGTVRQAMIEGIAEEFGYGRVHVHTGHEMLKRTRKRVPQLV